MFKKKTRTELIIETVDGDPFANVELDYAEAANAEIDRLNAELTALRAQVPTTERVWISRDRYRVFPEDGIYFFIDPDSGFWDAVRKQVNDHVPDGIDYLFVFDEGNLPVPPEPEPELEVKVGKYEINPRGTKKTTEVVCIEDGMCCYKFHDGGSTIKPVEWVKGCLEENNAVFIGEGDNQ